MASVRSWECARAPSLSPSVSFARDFGRHMEHAVAGWLRLWCRALFMMPVEKCLGMRIFLAHVWPRTGRCWTCSMGTIRVFFHSILFFCLSFSLSGGLRMLSCNYNSWCKPFPWRSRIAVADCERQVAVCCQHAPLPLPGRVRCVRREQHHEQPHYVFSCNIYGTHERVEAKFLYGRSQWAPRRRWQCPEPG